MNHAPRRPSLSFLFLLLASLPLLLGGPAATAQDRRPNIILILADDLGYGDLSAYGQRRLQTPRLDRMADEGLRFTQFYAGSTVCGPSRWALMTGRHVASAYRLQGDKPRAISFGQDDFLLPQALKQQGYRTAMYGKWGMSQNPEAQGFDSFLGYTTHVHAHSHFTDHLFEIRGGQTVQVDVDPQSFTQDLFMERALAFIEQNRDQPFFLYLPFALVHAELLVPMEDLAPFLDDKGQSRFLPDPPFPCCGVVGTYRGQPTPHAAFAAMVTRVDRDVGRVLDRLRLLGIDDNTVVLFTSDNGAHNEGGADVGYFEGNGPLRGFKRDLYEGGIRVPMIAWSGSDLVQPGPANHHPWTMWDLFPTIAELTSADTPNDLDGVSMMSLLQGQNPPSSDRILYWEYNDPWAAQRPLYSQAVRQGDWKLIRFRDPNREWVELFNLSQDITEYHSLAGEHPGIADQLVDHLNRLRTDRAD